MGIRDFFSSVRTTLGTSPARRVFEALAEEEKRHLDLLTERLGRMPHP